MPGTVLTVASGKGGVGKTTTAVNLAVALWREGNAVAVVDADLGMANLAAVLGLEPETTLHDVLAGRASLDEAVVEARDGDLVVLPGERDLSGFASADPGKLGEVLAELAEGRDYVVVDTGAGLSYEDVLPLGLADAALLVTTPEPAAVGDTRKTLELSGLLEGSVLGVVVTRAREDTDAAAVAAEVGVDLLGVVPEDPAVTESTMGGGPLESLAPDAPATAAYREIAAAVEEASVSVAPSAAAPETSSPSGDEPAAQEPKAAAESGAVTTDGPEADAEEAQTSGDGDGPDDAETPAGNDDGDEDAASDEGDADEAPAQNDEDPDGAETPTGDDDGDEDAASDEGDADEAPARNDEDPDDETAPDDEPDEAEPAADGDEGPDEPDDDAGDGDADADESEEGDGGGGRGGLLGWLGLRR